MGLLGALTMSRRVDGPMAARTEAAGDPDDFFRDREDDVEQAGILALVVLRDVEEHPVTALRADVCLDLARERSVPVVELRAGHVASPELGAEIQAWARERMAGYKVPRTVDFEDALPRQENGKLYKRVLKDRWWPTEGRRI